MTEEEQSEAVSQEPEQVQNMPWTFLTDGVFHNTATVTVGQDLQGNPNEGHWIDFHSNGRYDYGIWDETKYSGTWFYDNETSLLELTPEKPEKPSQWRVMHKDNTIILQGTPKYHNNAQQIRYIRHEGRPER